MSEIMISRLKMTRREKDQNTFEKMTRPSLLSVCIQETKKYGNSQPQINLLIMVVDNLLTLIILRRINQNLKNNLIRI